MKNKFTLLFFCIIGCLSFSVVGQNVIYRPPFTRIQPTLINDTTTIPIIKKIEKDSMILDTAAIRNRPKKMREASELDTILNQLKAQLDSPDFYTIEVDTTISTLPIPLHFFRQPVFCGYNPSLNNDIDIYQNALNAKENQLTQWIGDEIAHNRHLESIKQTYMIEHPQTVRYNLETLPIAPKRVFTKIDPSKSKLTVDNQDVSVASADFATTEIKRRNWLHTFNGLLQFSQAYISPNWYQGGNNNLNMLLNTEFNIKLNEAFHPNLLFETDFKYKLAINNAPEDTLRNYSISDDIFQINSKFGVRAAKRWFYSIQVQFKTQLLNGYTTNTHDLKAAFLSPSELNVGLGMTYNYANEKKTFTFDASISPLSYNMKTCTNWRIDETAFGIEQGKKTASQIGSSGEAKLKWQIAHNISLATRLFAFTDYSYFQGDLENTLSFAINRFLSTQINVHLRYDSSAAEIAGSRWGQFQMKEILSFGFAYSFKNL